MLVVALFAGSVKLTFTVLFPLSGIVAFPSLSVVMLVSSPLMLATALAFAIGLPSRSLTVTVTELPSSVVSSTVAFALGSGTSTGTSTTLVTTLVAYFTVAPFSGSVYESSTVALSAIGTDTLPFSSVVKFCSSPSTTALMVALAIGLPSLSVKVATTAPSSVSTSIVPLATTGTSTGTSTSLVLRITKVLRLGSA